MSAKQGAYYRIEYPLNLTKKYSKRLYYLLKDKETFNGGVFVISFDELRKMMKIPESYANGKVKRVKRNSTIVEYETIEENGETVSTTEDEQEIIDLFDCSIKEARDILRTAKANDRTHEQLIEILSYTLKKQVENKVGYALTILKNGYNEPTKLGGRQNGSAWNNKDLDTAYAQMNFEDLEKQLLSN